MMSLILIQKFEFKFKDFRPYVTGIRICGFHPLSPVLGSHDPDDHIPLEKTKKERWGKEKGKRKAKGRREKSKRSFIVTVLIPLS